MKAEIITYETKGMNNSSRSIVSKRLFGFTDRTRGSQYVYKREGVLERIAHAVLTKKTIVVGVKNAREIKKIIKSYGAHVKSWTIQISAKEMRKRYG
ncbi:MAG: hypothetical protein KKG59_00670 [Nanoarchaeota archaeon]|nr:hypothetical protein [Nanoarchaeota archaeon]